MLRSSVFTAIVAAFGILASGAVLAQTADGSTPAEETVCDSEVGAAFGLCNAYCEAMDCDSLNPQASETACTKVFGKFENITGTPPPCENLCPCRLSSFLATEFNTQQQWQCFDTVSGSTVATNIQHAFVDPTSDLAAVDFQTGGAGVCTYSRQPSPGDLIRVFQLTQEEATACAEQIRTFAAAHENDDPPGNNNNQCFLPSP